MTSLSNRAADGWISNQLTLLISVPLLDIGGIGRAKAKFFFPTIVILGIATEEALVALAYHSRLLARLPVDK